MQNYSTEVPHMRFLFEFVTWELSFDIAYAHARKKADRNLIETVEKEVIQRALKECKGNQVKASFLLGITRATLRKRIDAFEIRF